MQGTKPRCAYRTLRTTIPRCISITDLGEAALKNKLQRLVYTLWWYDKPCKAGVSGPAIVPAPHAGKMMVPQLYLHPLAVSSTRLFQQTQASRPVTVGGLELLQHRRRAAAAHVGRINPEWGQESRKTQCRCKLLALACAVSSPTGSHIWRDRGRTIRSRVLGGVLCSCDYCVHMHAYLNTGCMLGAPLRRQSSQEPCPACHSRQTIQVLQRFVVILMRAITTIALILARTPTHMAC